MISHLGCFAIVFSNAVGSYLAVWFEFVCVLAESTPPYELFNFVLNKQLACFGQYEFAQDLWAPGLPYKW